METQTDPLAAHTQKRKYIRKYATAFNRVVKYLEHRGAKPLFRGTQRAAMIRGDVIYKIPVDSTGGVSNIQEDFFFNKMCKQKEYFIPHFRGDLERGGSILGFARCRLLWIYKVPVLMMERVTPFYLNDERISADMRCLDGGQFGEGRKGDYLSYDYSRTLAFHVPYNQVPDALNEKIEKYNEKFHKTWKEDWGATGQFQPCFGVPNIEQANIIKES